MVRRCGATEKFARRIFKEARLRTCQTLAVTSPAHPESAKMASLPKDASCPRQGLRRVSSHSISKGWLGKSQLRASNEGFPKPRGARAR